MKEDSSHGGANQLTEKAYTNGSEEGTITSLCDLGQVIYHVTSLGFSLLDCKT